VWVAKCDPGMTIEIAEQPTKVGLIIDLKTVKAVGVIPAVAAGSGGSRHPVT